MWYNIKLAQTKPTPKHGEPFEFDYWRNLQKSPDFGETYGQHIEPAGTYVIENSRPIPDGYEGGKMNLNHPYVIDFGSGDYKHHSNWKHVLSQKYNGLTGLKLTKALIAEGYDGIVTIDKYGTSEIVSFKNI